VRSLKGRFLDRSLPFVFRNSGMADIILLGGSGSWFSEVRSQASHHSYVLRAFDSGRMTFVTVLLRPYGQPRGKRQTMGANSWSILLATSLGPLPSAERI
jgi:hypothetical protein